MDVNKRPNLYRELNLNNFTIYADTHEIILHPEKNENPLLLVHHVIQASKFISKFMSILEEMENLDKKTALNEKDKNVLTTLRWLKQSAIRMIQNE